MTEYTDWREWEFRIHSDTASEIQKLLNQWKLEYYLVIVNFIANQDGCTILVARKRFDAPPRLQA